MNASSELGLCATVISRSGLAVALSCIFEVSETAVIVTPGPEGLQRLTPFFPCDSWAAMAEAVPFAIALSLTDPERSISNIGTVVVDGGIRRYTSTLGVRCQRLAIAA